MMEAPRNVVSMAAFRERRQLRLPLDAERPSGRAPVGARRPNPGNLEHRERMLRFLQTVQHEARRQPLLR